MTDLNGTIAMNEVKFNEVEFMMFASNVKHALEAVNPDNLNRDVAFMLENAYMLVMGGLEQLPLTDEDVNDPDVMELLSFFENSKPFIFRGE